MTSPRERVERLQARARRVRARAAVRSRQLRQLDYAAGAWYRLTRQLALARRGWAISDEDATTLMARGHLPEPAGYGLEPPRRLFVVSELEIGTLRGAREVPLQVSPELLGCRDLALVPFAARTGDHT